MQALEQNAVPMEQLQARKVLDLSQIMTQIVRLRHDKVTRRLFVRYAAIGAGVQVLDVAVFQAFILLHAHPILAITAGGAAAMFTHFGLNRYANFRNFDRSIYHQFRTYLATTAMWWVVTVCIVQFCMLVLRMPPLASKLVAVGVNFPLNFLAARYFTFGPGIRAHLRKLLRDS